MKKKREEGGESGEGESEEEEEEGREGEREQVEGRVDNDKSVTTSTFSIFIHHTYNNSCNKIIYFPIPFR